MHRRTLFAVLALALIVALVVPASALGIRVHVRVEGATRTIFGSGQPLLTPFTGTVSAQDGTGVELLKAECSGRARGREPRRRVLLPDPGDLLRAVHRPDRAQRCDSDPFLGLQGQW